MLAKLKKAVQSHLKFFCSSFHDHKTVLIYNPMLA
jgi:hypothetical protein